ncbi:ChaN family lipoprotein [Salidesulfovibrio onnuriiensis]|uniref:ChaN family lipoprotein n=1 Tax=Salidesulfovibrio onnuriiensis TaxID=2583823 RepID=UPI0011CC8637|nr:ChaN family lipoprotein [Salidesulfovibrio onnuriiensis]
MNKVEKPIFGVINTLLLMLITAAALGGCVSRQAGISSTPMEVTFLPQRGDFLSVDGERLSLEQAVALTRDADYILLGEGHKNVCDHKIQQSFAEVLAEGETPFAVGLEMVAVDKQPVLDDFAEGIVPVPDLEEELVWKERWGYPFALFSGLFELAQKHSIPVAGLNVPPEVPRTISRDGVEALSEDQREFLPESIVYPADDQMDMLREVMAMHSGRDTDNATQLERFAYVQSLWDSKMAAEAVKLREKYNWPVLVIAGSGHVEYGWGIARRIRQYDPGARIVSVMPWRGGDFDAKAGDVFFYCPESYVSRLGAVFTVMREGIVVESVERGSRADSSGFRPGDVLVSANGIDLRRLMDIYEAGKAAHDHDRPLVFTVRRGDVELQVDVGLLGRK